jgi:cyclophilin family peptidyl-prolyl cis-trans isomerase
MFFPRKPVLGEWNGDLMKINRILACMFALSLLIASCAPENVTETARETQWDAPPEMSVDPDAIYLATLHTDKGDIVIELFADRAPKTVNNFIFLAEMGYYDHTTFHRVIPDFMAQGGDPTGTGTGGPGYTFEDEILPDQTFDEPGYLAMANRGTNTNGSQFFINYVATTWLDANHTIFGKVVRGMDVVEALTPRDPSDTPDFDGDELITVTITEAGTSLLPPATSTPVAVIPELQDGRPYTHLALRDRENLFTGKPEMVIDPTQSYQAQIETSKGTILIELRPDEAPDLVNNFFVLASLGYWDRFPIVHVDEGMFVLTGAPSGEPTSDVGYTLAVDGELTNSEGAVGYWYRTELMAPSGSQFYILMTDMSEYLDESPTVFGYVIEGMDVVRELTTDDEVLSIIVE